MLSLFRTTSCAAVRLSAGARAGIPGMRRFNATEAMDDYERKIHGILTERFHPAKLLVKDVSGT